MELDGPYYLRTDYRGVFGDAEVRGLGDLGSRGLGFDVMMSPLLG